MSKDRKKFVALADEALAKGDNLAREEMMITHKGLLYPVVICSPETFKALESFEARSEDVLLAGYPKSGTNWVGQILTDLVDRSAKDTNNADDDQLEEFPYLEVGDAEKYQRMANLPIRRVMFTHLRPSNLPTSVFKKKVKILLLIRNPKDVATSFYHMCNQVPPIHMYDSWDEYFKGFMSGQVPWGSYFDYLSEWNEHAEDENVMTITYEELKQDRASGVKRISEFFELNLTEQEIQEVVDKSSFEAMKENSDKTHGKIGKALFRKGGVSDWKNIFNEENNQEMDTTFEERLGGTILGEKLKIIQPAEEKAAGKERTKMTYVRKTFIDILEKAMEEGKKKTPEEKLLTYDGVVYPTTLCSPEVFKALESFEARSDDVILAGYCKSGTNWVGQIVTDLVVTSAKKHGPHKLNEKLLLAEFPYLEIGDTEKYKRMKTYPSRRVIFTHLRADKLPESVFRNKAKIILLLRNPKDVAASFFHFSNNFSAYPPYDYFDDYFQALMKGQMPWGSYIEYLCVWNKYIDKENVMPITYEAMKENTAVEAKKVAEFLGLNLDDEDIHGVAERSTFKAMKENSQTTHGEFGAVLFRKGGVSDWKTLFNEQNNQEMDRVFQERLAGTKVGAKIKYDVYCKA